MEARQVTIQEAIALGVVAQKEDEKMLSLIDVSDNEMFLQEEKGTHKPWEGVSLLVYKNQILNIFL